MRNPKIKKAILLAAGTAALTAGTIGLIVPILPTTPFLLLAAFCYLRSSQRLYNWLTSHRLFGPYIENYFTHRAVKRRSKVIALVMLWISLLISFLLVDILPVRILLPAVGLAVSLHILKLKTLETIDNHGKQVKPCDGQ